MAEGSEHVHVVIDIIADELLGVRNKRHQTTTTNPLPCIVRVPEILRELNTKAYVPQVIGLGPYHHDLFNPNFNLRSHKFKALDRALGRSLDHQGLEATDENVKELLQQLLVYVASFENKIKACYSEDFEFHADVFMLDAVFLLELCFCYSQKKMSDRFHPLLDYRTLQTCVGMYVRRDLFKLENQIPLALLCELITWKGMFLPSQDTPDFSFNLTIASFPFLKWAEDLQQMMKDEPPPKHLIEYSHRCIVKSMRLGQRSNEDGSHSRTRSCSGRYWKCCCEKCSFWIISRTRTCSGRYWKCCYEKCSFWIISLIGIGRRMCFRKPEEEQNDYWVIPTAKELERVGIVVKASDDNNLCFKQGRFKLRGHLHLPKLWIADSSEMMLRNMIAYEEFCVQPGQRFFNRYMSLMTDLIQTDSDAALLIRQGIIQNFLENSESVAHLFNRLNMLITLDKIKEIDEEIVREVRAYYESSLRVMLREFMKTNFANPWYACATIAAVVVLVCTVIQAVYAVKSA